MMGCRLDDSRGDTAVAELAASLDELYGAAVAGLREELGALEATSCCAQSPPVQSNPRRIAVETVCRREILVMFPYTLVGSGFDAKRSNCSLYSYTYSRC